ncbi:uracil-DNA glycosylase [Nocardioides sp. AE5]|uniref:uracil-DNA glycosylase n=1 Tax=Nocardioides sp. AE5 TaxID=2962573 RepID=UPI0028828102|nr:uracil-DNA glycosylase [Nocardioides sp. AE5]MDT0202287.1 uracil-DNA glycosylase [Nocardioides sp. AE5]
MLHHPITGQAFDSPVPPGTGWPEDPATAETPVARSAAGVRRLAARAELADLDARISVCSACPRLVRWREEVAVTKRASFADEPYWGRPIPGWGSAHPALLIVGLAPAANGANRTGRVFTGDQSGDWLFASLHRVGLAGQAASDHAGDGQRLIGARMVATVRCAPPENKPTVLERDTCAPWIEREVRLLADDVRAVLALGSYGWEATLRSFRAAGYAVPRPKPRFGHGAETILGRPDGGEVTLVGCFHPSQHNTFTGRLTEEMTDAVLARARDLAALAGGAGIMAG